jgi:beta-lactamase class A
MRNRTAAAATLACTIVLSACASQGPSFRAPWEPVETPQSHAVEKALDHYLHHVRADVAVAYLDLASGSRVLHSETEQFHAASTMKVPVMVAAWAAIDSGQLKADQPITVHNEFRSILDGSHYQLAKEDDADPELYDLIGKTLSVAELIRHMIVRSSNLATNLLVDQLTASRINELMREVGANDIHVLRGVQDEKAFQAGFNNEVTAIDLMLLMGAIAQAAAAPDGPPATPDFGSATSPVAAPVISHRGALAMIETLKAQEFNEKIPAGLPAGTPVAHKTGDMIGYHHDVAVVYPAKASAYVLVILTGGFAKEEAANQLIADLSRIVWQTRETPIPASPTPQKHGRRGSD